MQWCCTPMNHTPTCTWSSRRRVSRACGCTFARQHCGSGDREFARHLRALGIAANATDRGVRGESRSPKREAIYRAEHRGESRHTYARAEAVAAELLKGNLRVE